MIKKFKLKPKKFNQPDTPEETISGLWRINEIILSTTDKDILYRKIVNVMLEELGYLHLGYMMIVLSLLSKNKKNLRRISISQTDYAKKALSKSPVKFNEIAISTSYKKNLSVRAIETGESYITNDLSDMLVPVVDRNLVRKVQRDLGVLSSLVIPITAKGEILGTIIFSLNKKEDKINEFEKQILVGFVNAVGVAIRQSNLFGRIEEANLKLIKLDKQKDEFINMAAHELRAPMTAIKGYVSMIMEGDAGEIPQKANDYLTDVASVTDRLIRLVNNMLNVSRIEEGRLVYSTEIVRVSDVAKNVCTSFRFEAERKGLKLETEKEPEINDRVEIDEDKLTEVMGNLVSNAVKYSDKGKIKIKITQPNKETVRVSVVDMGPGISKMEQKKLFQKFYRVESAVGKTIGTGLGLYISKLLIEKFNGKMGLNSDVGEGSDFWFELPITTKKKVETKSEPKQSA